MIEHHEIFLFIIPFIVDFGVGLYWYMNNKAGITKNQKQYKLAGIIMMFMSIYPFANFLLMLAVIITLIKCAIERK